MHEHDLSDAHAVIADPLQLTRDHDRRDDGPQVTRDGLLHRDEVDRAVLDGEAQLIDLPVCRHDILRCERVEAAESGDAALDGDVDEARQASQVHSKLLHALVERGARVDGTEREHQPKRPVM